MELLYSLQPWHWFVLALGLFALEVFATTEFFIGIAAAALLVSVLLFAMPELSWEWQMCCFGIGSVVLTVGYFKLFRKVNEATDSPLLNDRAGQLVGTRFTLDAAIFEAGAVMVQGSRWQARCSGELRAGETVEVRGAEGMTLILARLGD